MLTSWTTQKQLDHKTGTWVLGSSTNSTTGGGGGDSTDTTDNTADDTTGGDSTGGDTVPEEKKTIFDTASNVKKVETIAGKVTLEHVIDTSGVLNIRITKDFEDGYDA